MDLGSESRRFGFMATDPPTATSMPMLSPPSRSDFFPLPVPFMDIFGKAGAARWTLNGHDNSSLFALDEQGTDFAWGGGAQAHFGPLGLRLEYEQFNVRNTDGVKVGELRCSWHFL